MLAVSRPSWPRPRLVVVRVAPAVRSRVLGVATTMAGFAAAALTGHLLRGRRVRGWTREVLVPERAVRTFPHVLPRRDRRPSGRAAGARRPLARQGPDRDDPRRAGRRRKAVRQGRWHPLPLRPPLFSELVNQPLPPAPSPKRRGGARSPICLSGFRLRLPCSPSPLRGGGWGGGVLSHPLTCSAHVRTA